MRFLRNVVLAVGLVGFSLSFGAACGGKDKGANEPVKANPCNPCEGGDDAVNPCEGADDAANPCEGVDDAANPCEGVDDAANPCEGGDEG